MIQCTSSWTTINKGEFYPLCIRDTVLCILDNQGFRLGIHDNTNLCYDAVAQVKFNIDPEDLPLLYSAVEGDEESRLIIQLKYNTIK